MAFIAGYVAERARPTEAVAEQVRSFSILPGQSCDGYVQAVVATRFGHLIAKHKAAHPIPPGIAVDDAANALATLGYLFPRHDSEAMVGLASRTSARCLEENEGQFVSVFADAASGDVHIVNDRFASRPFYVLQRGDGVFFSSNLAFLLSLAEAPHRADVVGWLQVCTIGHTVGARTTSEGVGRLGPGRHLTISKGRITERQYWRLEHRPDAGLDPDAHATTVFDAFRESVERQTRLVGRGVLGLSGGLDSRMIAGALPPDTAFSAFTFVNVQGAPSTPETRAASAVAAALGLPHHVEALPIGFARSPEVIALTGGMRPYQHMAIVMAYIEEVRREGMNFLIGGGPGDSLAGAFIPAAAYTDPARVNECMDDALRRRLASRQGWSLVFRDDAIRANRRAVEDELAESLASVRGPTAAHRITAWAMTCRQPAFTFTTVLHTHPDVTEAAPHLGYRYTDLMLQLPATWLYKKTFYSYMIYRVLPELRHIPYANTGALLSGTRPTLEIAHEPLTRRAFDRAYSYGARATRRLVRSVLPARTTPQSPLFSDSTLIDYVDDCVHSLPALRDVVDVRRCETLLARTRAGTCPSEEALGGLTALCVSAAMFEPGIAERRHGDIDGGHTPHPFTRVLSVTALDPAFEAIPCVWNLWRSLA